MNADQERAARRQIGCFALLAFAVPIGVAVIAALVVWGFGL